MPQRILGAAEMIAASGGDHRTAEIECWKAWYAAGKPNPDTTGAVRVAIAVADGYHYPKDDEGHPIKKSSKTAWRASDGKQTSAAIHIH